VAPGGGREPATVVRITDGDTIRVELPGGEEERVRYIGIDTPEVRGEDECFGERATRANARMVGDRVELEYDVERRDRYGRLLAYVHADGRMVNAELVRRGFATVLTVPPNVRHAGRFLRLAREARRERRGLWRACGG
jgi:micrococcal nuclease